MVSRKEMKRMTKKVLAMSSPTMVFFESVRRETTVQLPSAKILTMPKDYFLMTIQGGPEKILLETIDSFVVNSNFCEPSCRNRKRRRPLKTMEQPVLQSNELSANEFYLAISATAPCQQQLIRVKDEIRSK